jgi:hypothetical protein
MRMVQVALSAGLALSLADCAGKMPGISLVTDPPGAPRLVITDSPGGNVDAFNEKFLEWSAIKGLRVEIRAWCASACTQVLTYFAPSQICFAPGARMGFHAVRRVPTVAAWASNGPGIPGMMSDTDSLTTLEVFMGYPAWVQARLRAVGVMGLGTGNPAASVPADEFWMHGYRVCPGKQDGATAASSTVAQHQPG